MSVYASLAGWVSAAFAWLFSAAASRLLTVTPLVGESRLRLRLHGSRASVLLAAGSGHRLRGCRLWTQAQWLPAPDTGSGAAGSGHRLRGCGAQAWLSCGVWDPPGPGIEPVSPALAGRFFTTEPLGKPLNSCLTKRSITRKVLLFKSSLV